MNKNYGIVFATAVLAFFMIFGSIISGAFTYADEQMVKEAKIVVCKSSSCTYKNCNQKLRRRLLGKEKEEIILEDDEQCTPLGTITLDDEETPLGNVKLSKPKKNINNVKVCLKKEQCDNKKIYLKFIMDKNTLKNQNNSYRGFYDLAFAISGGFIVVEESD